MKNVLVQSLKAVSKHGEFDSNASVIGYKTGFPVLDYYLGYNVNVYDGDDSIIDSYPCTGFTAGSVITWVGKSSTSKTTVVTQIAANIVRNFNNGFVIHYDLEQALNYTRLSILTNFSIRDMEEGKYILRQERNSLDDIYETIMKIYFEKVNNPDKYKYDTGKLNEFGKPIILFEPTVVVIDSIATLTEGVNENDKTDVKKVSEMEGQTYGGRRAGAISQFFTKLMPRIRTANIILICINQLKEKIDIGFKRSASDMLYLDQDETSPGGRAPWYYSHIFLKSIAIGSEKYEMEKDGFDGFGVNVRVVKSRTNINGPTFPVMYDKVKGVDSIRTTLRYAKDNGLLTGTRRDNMYFLNDKEKKISLINPYQSIKDDPSIIKTMYDVVIPHLESKLSTVVPEETAIHNAIMDY